MCLSSALFSSLFFFFVLLFHFFFTKKPNKTHRIQANVVDHLRQLGAISETATHLRNKNFETDGCCDLRAAVSFFLSFDISNVVEMARGGFRPSSRMLKIGGALALVMVFLLGINLGHESAVARIAASPMSKFVAASDISNVSQRQIIALKQEISSLKQQKEEEKVPQKTGVVLLCFQSRDLCRKLIQSVSGKFSSSKMFLVEENNVASSVLGKEKNNIVRLTHVQRLPRLSFGVEELKKHFFMADLYFFALEQVFTERNDIDAVLMLEEGVEISPKLEEFARVAFEVLWSDPTVFSVCGSPSDGQGLATTAREMRRLSTFCGREGGWILAKEAFQLMRGEKQKETGSCIVDARC